MNKIFETQFGSHVYGTHTPASDQDFKGIYLASLEDIILKKDKETVRKDTKVSTSVRNTSEDIDRDYKELRRFITDACSGQTYALDMLFTPSNHWTVHTEIWDRILEHREKFLSKNVKTFIGYAMHQAAKYGIRGSRLAAVEELILWSDGKVGELSGHLSDLPQGKYVSIIEREGQQFVEVLQKCFPLNSQIKAFRKSLEQTAERYGQRAQDAKSNNGVDWKAISHAYRAALQVISLATYKKIVYPLHQADFLKDVKQGKKSWDFVSEDLANTIDLAKRCMENSDLPEEVDTAFWDEFILTIYKEYYGIERFT